MNGREKSDPGIVAVKPANKAERSAAEPVERRAGAEGFDGTVAPVAPRKSVEPAGKARTGHRTGRA